MRAISVRSFLLIVGSLGSLGFLIGWSRRDPPRLQLRQVKPSEPILRGEPLASVDVEMEIDNPTSDAVRIAPLSMACSCQILRPPATAIPARSRERFQLQFRFPPFGSQIESVEIQEPSGKALLFASVNLECTKPPPYFTKLPPLIELPMIKGVSDGRWETSVVAWEVVDHAPYVTGARIDPMTDCLSVEVAEHQDAQPHTVRSVRTYVLKIRWNPQGDALLDSLPADTSIVLDLSDGKEQRIPLELRCQDPLAFVFDAKTGALRGIRRGGASGVVRITPYPPDAGQVLPDRFNADSKIVAEFHSSNSSLQGVDALFDGPAGEVPVSVRFRKD